MMKQFPPTPNSITTGVEDIQTMPHYPVKLYEIFGVGLGAMLIVAFALFELANQFFTKIKNPEQAESIIKQVVEYEMPGGSQGLKSLKTNTEAFALVGNRQNPPSLLLLVSKTPVEKHDGEASMNLVDELNIPTALVGTWQNVRTTVENKRFCDQIMPVTIRQGTYRLIESPRKQVEMREYMIVQPLKNTQHRIQLFGIGSEGARQLEAVFRSFTCPQPQ